MNLKFKLSVTVCIFYLTNFTFFFVSLTWRKQNKKQQHGGRLKLKMSLYHLPVIPLLSVYLRSEFAPDSTMWSDPPSQSMAVDANL